MKKAIAALFSLSMVFCLAACGNDAGQTEPSAENDFAEIGTGGAEGGAGYDAQTESGVQPEGGEESDVETGSSEESDVETGSGAESDVETQDGKVLVAYFSATGTTEGVAQQIADGLHADLYKIIPEEPYTDADLNYNDNNSRSTVEMSDPSSRPAISGSVEHMEQYDIVFIGYPNMEQGFEGVLCA